MGGLTSVATTAMQALGAANSVLGAVNAYQYRSGKADYSRQRQENEVSLRNAQEQAALQKEQLRLTAEQTEAERRAALRRAVAKQRAQFGASGVGSAGGSSQAVLLGLFDESEEDRARRESLDTLKASVIDQNVLQQQRINTLQLTQLKERDRLKKVGNTLGTLTDVGNAVF